MVGSRTPGCLVSSLGLLYLTEVEDVGVGWIRETICGGEGGGLLVGNQHGPRVPVLGYTHGFYRAKSGLMRPPSSLSPAIGAQLSTVDGACVARSSHGDFDRYPYYPLPVFPRHSYRLPSVYASARQLPWHADRRRPRDKGLREGSRKLVILPY